MSHLQLVCQIGLQFSYGTEEGGDTVITFIIRNILSFSLRANLPRDYPTPAERNTIIIACLLRHFFLCFLRNTTISSRKMFNVYL